MKTSILERTDRLWNFSNSPIPAVLPVFDRSRSSWKLHSLNGVVIDLTQSSAGKAQPQVVSEQTLHQLFNMTAS
jgi:hypothetical protein